VKEKIRIETTVSQDFQRTLNR